MQELGNARGMVQTDVEAFVPRQHAHDFDATFEEAVFAAATREIVPRRPASGGLLNRPTTVRSEHRRRRV